MSNKKSALKSKTMEQLEECIENTSADLGLTVGEFKVYSENRLSIDKSNYSRSDKEYFKKLYARLCEEKREQNLKDEKGYCSNHTYNKYGKGEFSYWLDNFNLFGYEFSDDKYVNITIGICRIILTVPILFLLGKFMVKDVFQLASIKH